MLFANAEFSDSIAPPPGRFPYYIVVPPYVRTSAGIRALHALCHWLNRLGQSSYLLLYPNTTGLRVNPELVTPVLDQDIVHEHFRQGRAPIVLYPEVIGGNPFAAPVSARFIANYPGLLGGTSAFAEDELCFAFSKRLGELLERPYQILTVPVIDTQVFRSDPAVPRSGVCFYAAKFQEYHQGKVFGLPPGAIEIKRSGPELLLPLEIADLFRRSELFYCFEDSALITEAALCGCPVVLMKNQFFQSPLGMDEFGWDGYAWGNDPLEVARARQTVHQAYDNYSRLVPLFFTQLHQFVLTTQRRARATPYVERMILPDQIIAGPDQMGTLRRRLTDAIKEIDQLKGNQTSQGTVWSPSTGCEGALSPVTFIDGWFQTPAGASLMSETGLCAIVPPADASILEFHVTATDESLGDFEFIVEGESVANFEIAVGEKRIIDIPVLYDVKPIIVLVAASGGLRPREKSSRERRSGLVVERVAVRAHKLEHNRSTSVSDATQHSRRPILSSLGKPISSYRCSVEQRPDGVEIHATAEDSHVIFSIGRIVSWSDSTAHLWGTYSSDQDSVAQVFVPTEAGDFSEARSATALVPSSSRSFVMTLPAANKANVLRLDFLDHPGRVLISNLELVIAPQNASPQDNSTAALSSPVAPNLSRFERRDLMGQAFEPRAVGAQLVYRDGALVMDSGGGGGQMICILDEPLVPKGEGILLWVECDCDRQQTISVIVPCSDGKDIAASQPAQPGINSLVFRIAISEPLSIIRIDPLKSAGIVTFRMLDLLLPM